MTKPHRHRLLRIILLLLLLLIIGGGAFAWWLSAHYKELIKNKVPEMVLQSTDSVYSISFSDVNVSLFKHTVTIKDLKLTANTKQAAALRKAHRHIPVTLSTVSIPQLDASGIAWGNLVSDKSLDCDNVAVHGLKWLMVCAPHPQDSLFTRDAHSNPKITRITVAHADIYQPDITYHYEGRKDSFICYLKGGSAVLNKWVYNDDKNKDTSTFLYAGNGNLRLDSFILRKKEGRYVVKKPLLDFETEAGSVSLKNVKLHHLTNHDPASGNVKEIYDLSFPEIEMAGFNWNKLINDNQLQITKLTGTSPDISLRYIRENESNSPKTGSYPSQLLLQVGIHTNVEALHIHNGRLKYVEVTKDKQEATIEFTNIKGLFTNITNMDSVIALHKDCVIKLEGKYNNKSPVAATFTFRLTDTTGHFIMNGNLENLDGNDVIKQVQAFSVVEVTSFHLSRIDMHEEGNEHYAKGNFTMLYEDLKISLFKFKSNARKGKHGPLSFLGSTLVLYPSNPMKNKDVRKVSTYFDREPQQGFISLVWKNIYRGAKKTAARSEGLINLTDGKEDKPGEPPRKKSFLRRLFSRNK